MKTESLGVVLAAGDVLRCHTMPCVNRQTVGGHTWRTMVLLHWLFHPHYPPPRVTYALMMHDVPEVHTGDMPGDVKAAHPELADALGIIERRFEVTHGITCELLYPDEVEVLAFCDRADLTLYALGERDMGNSYMAYLAEKAFNMTSHRAENLRAVSPTLPYLPRVEELMDMLDHRMGKT